jgi:site-specific DNA-methyltransferase (adenine-specific)
MPRHNRLLPATHSKFKRAHIFNYELMKDGQWPEDQLKKLGNQMRSVWAVGTPKPTEKKFGKHPTQKPLDLLRRIVLASTNKGDIVLDPFNGSGTTGLAAIANNRKYIGIDTEKSYLDLSIKRFRGLKQ